MRCHLACAIKARRRTARHYDELLADVPVITPITAPGQYHSFNYYTIRVERRDDLCRHLQARGIGHKVYYPVPLHLQPCFALLGGKPGQLPHSELAARQVLSLPLYPGLVCEQQEQVAAAIADFYKG
jgi:dTDP-4-amino-4,6-dideoxygalactose transaminase